MPNEWDESMSTGVPALDEQHRRLIALLGRLRAAMAEGRGVTEVGDVLDGLAAYAALHFGEEEACMRRYACPAALANERAHREFVGIFERFRAEYESEGASVRLVFRVDEQLSWWLDNHIRAIDTQLLPCVVRASG